MGALALIYFRLCKSIYIYTDEQHITATFSNIYDYPIHEHNKKTYDFMSIHKLREYSIWNIALKKIEFEGFFFFLHFNRISTLNDERRKFHTTQIACKCTYLFEIVVDIYTTTISFLC